MPCKCHRISICSHLTVVDFVHSCQGNFWCVWHDVDLGLVFVPGFCVQTLARKIKNVIRKIIQCIFNRNFRATRTLETKITRGYAFYIHYVFYTYLQVISSQQNRYVCLLILRIMLTKGNLEYLMQRFSTKMCHFIKIMK